MRAMVLKKNRPIDERQLPLELGELPEPIPKAKQVLVKVSACGVCHTELDEIEGRTPPPRLPVVLGHQVVGRVEAVGDKVHRLQRGDRVGIAWIYSSCGTCAFCRAGNENLCPHFQATGRDANGGYAELMVVQEDFAFPIPVEFTDVEAAPLLCAGAIGYRSLRLTGLEDGKNLGLTGFGASAHLVLKLAKYEYPNTNIFVFARSEKERLFAKELGAVWAGDTTEASPEKLDSIIDTTPVWKPIMEALGNLAPGGRLVINAIRKEDGDKAYLSQLDYSTHLWMEKEIKSVANVSRGDVSGFLKRAAEIPIKPDVQEYPLEQANQALLELKARKIRGAKVLRVA